MSVFFVMIQGHHPFTLTLMKTKFSFHNPLVLRNYLLSAGCLKFANLYKLCQKYQIIMSWFATELFSN